MWHQPAISCCSARFGRRITGFTSFTPVIGSVFPPAHASCQLISSSEASSYCFRGYSTTSHDAPCLAHGHFLLIKISNVHQRAQTPTQSETCVLHYICIGGDDAPCSNQSLMLSYSQTGVVLLTLSGPLPSSKYTGPAVSNLAEPL